MRRLHSVVLLVLITLASGGLQAAKPGGGTPPPSGSACAEQGGAFPAMAYARGVFSKTGSYGRTQIFVANSLGTCEVIVYDSGDYDRSAISGLSFHYEAGSNTGTLAWSQVRDNGERYGTGRQVIKVAEFHVASGAVLLPVSAATVYRSPVDGSAISDVALSQDGTRLAFSTEQPTGTFGVSDYQVLMCNVPSCVPAVEFASRTVKALDLAIGRNPVSGLERIYFDDAHHRLVMIERSGDGWLEAILLSTSLHYASESGTQIYEPSVLSLPGEEDRVLLNSRDGSGPWRVDLYDVATATLVPFVGSGYGPSWTLFPSIPIDDAAPNALAAGLPGSSTSAVREIDLDGQADEVTLGVTGYGVDSAY